jgi:transposase InsO family protein
VQKIEQVFKAHARRYGSPRVTRALRQEGGRVGKNQVARLMRQQQLAARKKRAFRPKTTVAAERAEPNRIANLVPERPIRFRSAILPTWPRRKAGCIWR